LEETKYKLEKEKKIAGASWVVDRQVDGWVFLTQLF
jgi:hypothetical protein